MMWTRAIASLPCRRPISSGTALESAMSPMIRNSAAFSFWLLLVGDAQQFAYIEA